MLGVSFVVVRLLRSRFLGRHATQKTGCGGDYVMVDPKKPLCLFFLQESVYDRIKKTGGPNPFNLFVIAEMECMHKLLACVRETLLVNEFV